MAIVEIVLLKEFLGLPLTFDYSVRLVFPLHFFRALSAFLHA